jgi:hypothetical protein
MATGRVSTALCFRFLPVLGARKSRNILQLPAKYQKGLNGSLFSIT